MDSDRREPEQGRMLGEYRVFSTVGSGGMGVVYAAWDTRLERRVALKMLHPHLLTNPAVSRRFLREARAAARIEHPNVVRIYRMATIGDDLAIEMQYIEGTSLSNLLRPVPLPAGQAADILHQVLTALAACHAQGVIHCDIKPSNLLIDSEGRILLTDFGIARALQCSGGDQEGTTATLGAAWGTPRYTPPESWNGEEPSPAWDLYSLGVLIYEALAGHPAFHANTPAGLMHQILAATPEPLNISRPDLSEGFVTLIHDLMAQDPAHRPASALAALERLHNTREYEDTNAETQPLHGQARHERVRPTDRSILRSARGRFAAALLVLAVIVAIFYGQTPRREASQASREGSGLDVDGRHKSNEFVRQNEEHSSLTTATGLLALPQPRDLVGNRDGVYFVYDDGSHGEELWFVSPKGEVTLVRDLVPGPSSSRPRYLIQKPLDSGVLFSATTPEYGEEPWFCRKTGPLEFDVFLVKDIIPGTMGSEPRAFGAMDNIYFLNATTLHDGREPWITTVREQQTAMIQDVYPGNAGSVGMFPMTEPGPRGYYFFGLQNADNGLELFRYEHDKLHISHVSDVFEGVGAMALVGESLIFSNKDEAHGVEPWIWVPGSPGISMLADIEPGPESSKPGSQFSWKGLVFFTAATQATGIELWKTDGTTEGTTLVGDLNPGPVGSDPFAFVDGGDYLLFRATTAAHGNELWATDGSREGTQMLVDAWPGPESGRPYNVGVDDGHLFFTASDGVHGEELWHAKLLAGEVPSRVSDLWPGLNGSEPHAFTFIGSQHAIFAFKNPELGPALGFADWSGGKVDLSNIVLPHAAKQGADAAP